MTNLLILDYESTGVDVLSDRIVTANLTLMAPDGSVITQQDWVVDPGICIPDGAAAVHGWTTERVREWGADPARALEQIFAIIQSECGENRTVLCGFNIAYDLSLQEAERRRLLPGTPALRYHQEGENCETVQCVRVFDAYVADKFIDRFRKGSRKLGVVAEHYGITVDQSRTHAADYDCYLAGLVALRLLQHDRLRGLPFEVIHEGLALAHADQAASLQAYFAKSGKTNEDGSPIVCDPGWPLHTALTTANAKEAAA